MSIDHRDGLSIAGLWMLIVLQSVMLAALLAGVPPHPPAAIPLFGMGPFLGASLALAAGAITLGGSASRVGACLSVLAVAGALVSFGPQKWVDPAIGLIWPAVLLAEIACLALLVRAVPRLIARPRPAATGRESAA